MGTPNIDVYRRFVFRRLRIAPMLEDAWAGLRAPWTCVYREGKELVKTKPEEPDVLWIFHPSYRHSNPQFPKLEVPKAEKRNRREEIWERIVGHLRDYA